eukprot:gene2976-3716_t
MSRICDITGKRSIVGNKVSHANNKTKRRFYPNLQFKKFYVPETGSWVMLRVSASIIRTINKKGILAVMKEAQSKGTINQLLCTEHRKSGMPGMSRYSTEKNRKNTTDRLKVVATLRKSGSGKNLARLITCVKSATTNAYSFKEEIVTLERAKEIVEGKKVS